MSYPSTRHSTVRPMERAGGDSRRNDKGACNVTASIGNKAFNDRCREQYKIHLARREVFPGTENYNLHYKEGYKFLISTEGTRPRAKA